MSYLGMIFGKIGVEEPAFELLFTRSLTSPQTPYEIRRYGKRYAIETTMEPSEKTSSPFMALAGYIGVTKAPENEKKEAIAMTAPVAMDKNHQSGVRTMKFILPSSYDDLTKIPKPTNADKVTIKELAPAVGAVHRFSGSFDESKCHDKVRALASQLLIDGVDLPKGDDGLVALDKIKYEWWGFNPPFTLPFLKRNEVWIELDETQVEKLIASQTKDSES
ncbi:hypothetical protein HJC23_002901 [Cyclotella cryptica]|uniref:SOUL heme-binding protein n=1 Tax=Cyclotella cryptica TaxID=29204 RepID=A0ABD3PJJ5_9STRA|eukprot:CCRYP_014129-RA/>CCRYP_014129-RA protein AED:0.02 eAED:0.02 QI:256/1/1/1/1/1/2/698/219